MKTTNQKGLDGYVYFPRPEDRQIINDEMTKFSLIKMEELRSIYQSYQSKGWLGSRPFALKMIALHFTFLKKMGQSPFKHEGNIIEFGPLDHI